MQITARVRTTGVSILGLGLIWGGWLTGTLSLDPASLRAAEAEPVAKLVQSLASPLVSHRLQTVLELVDHEGPDTEVVAALIKALVDDEPKVRYVALTGLQRRGPAARVALPLVVRILQLPEKDAALRIEALHLLGSLGSDATFTAEIVAKSLLSSDSLEAVTAVSTLVRILPGDHRLIQQAAPVALRALQEKRPEVRAAAVVALGEIGSAAVPAVSELLGTAGSAHDPELLIAGAAALEAMGPLAAPAVPALARLLVHPQERVIVQAARSLGAIGPAAKAAVSGLRKRLEQKEVSSLVKLHIVTALGDIATAAEEAVPPLTRALAEEDEAIRRAAAKSLGQHGPAAKSAVPALILALTDSSSSVPLQAADALRRMGPEAVPELTASLRDEKLRHWATLILSDMGPAAKLAVPELIKLLSDPSLEVRREATVALAQIGPEAKAATPALLRILQSEKPEEPRPGAAYALGKIGAKEAIPLLQQRLQQKSDPNLSMISAWSLVILEPENAEILEQALPQLIQAIRHPWVLARREAIMALSRIGPAARPAIPALIEALDDPDALVRNEALVILGELGPAARTAISKIILKLNDSDPQVRYSACFALGRIGPAAQAALPALLRNLREPDDFLQIASAWALVHIAPRAEQSTRLALPALIRGMKYPDPQVRIAVLEATQHLQQGSSPGRRVLQDTIEAASRDTNESVRLAATTALDRLKKLP